MSLEYVLSFRIRTSTGAEIACSEPPRERESHRSLSALVAVTLSGEIPEFSGYWLIS
jgi:hypothetical protein